MHDLFSVVTITALLSGGVAAGVPLLLTGLGEQIAERAGVLNIGIEGIMLGGAYAGFLGAYLGNGAWWGFVAGAGAGAAIGLVVIVLCVWLGLDQIVVGIGLTIGTRGLTSVLQGAQFGTTYPRLGATPTLPLPLLSDLPVVGSGLFDQPLPVYLAVGLVGLAHWTFCSTMLGLNLRAAGARPAALDAAGVSVAATRAWAELVAGALIGLGGAYLAIVGAGIFVPFMTHGQGYIGLVVAMLARGRPLWVLYGAYLFGLALSLQTVLQLTGIGVSTDLVNMLPFAAVMVTLIIFARRSYLPAALGRPYVRGERH